MFEGERHFSLIFPSEIRTKYQDLNTRNLLEWDSFFGKFVSKVKFAALSEKYKYFGNINSNAYTFGQVRTYIGKYDLAFDAGNAIKLNAVVDFTQNKGEGSDIKNEQRNIGSASLLFKHKLTQKILYELSVRKELTNNYKSPFLFSLGTKWAASDFYTLKLNG
ncbi:MAG: TonB-dependent receptor, partial [Flavobacterium sp.]|nr:TonB-dependent receptor [Flavobacterium sp.]